MNRLLANMHIILLCLSSFTAMADSGKDTANLAFYLQKYKIDKINPLIIVAVNANECQPYKIGLDAIRKEIEEQKIEKNVLYLFSGLRQNEVTYYIKNVLKFTTDIYAISDEHFFKTISPSLSSMVIIFSPDGNSSSYRVFDAVNYLKIEKLKINYKLTLADSVILNEKAAPISSRANIYAIDEKRILITDPNYNTVSIYDLDNGKRKYLLEPHYDYEKLFEQYIAKGNDKKAKFAASTHALIKQFEQQEFKIYNVFTVNSKIYITVAIMYPAKVGEDTVLSDYPFLLITDTSFTKQTYIHIPTHSDSCFILLRNPFYVLHDSTMIFTIGRTKAIQNSENRFLAKLNLSEKNAKIKWQGLLNVKLPPVFTENGRYNNFDFNRFFDYKGQLYCYFTNILPFVYNVEDSRIISYPNEFYKSSSIENYFLKSSPFSIETIDYFSFDDLCFVTNENGVYFFSILDAEKNTIKYKVRIPNLDKKMRFSFDNNNLFSLNITPYKVVIYKYKFVAAD